MIRVGIGYDVHRLVEGRPLIIGGVNIPGSVGLDGHSDADVLLHAIMDALLGAAALGDIGHHFPDSEPAWKGVESSDLLRRVNELLRNAGASVQNIDATIVLETPKIAPYIEEMRSKIAAVLGLEEGRVSVKATTSEGLGFVGENSGAAALATCCVNDGS